jgi:hypothetical protein
VLVDPVARAVAACDDDGEPLSAGRLAEAAGEVLGRSLTVDPAVLAAALDPDRVVADARQQPGGSAPWRVREHAAAVDRMLATARRLAGSG